MCALAKHYTDAERCVIIKQNLKQLINVLHKIELLYVYYIKMLFVVESFILLLTACIFIKVIALLWPLMSGLNVEKCAVALLIILSVCH